jgi:hypothetical protein
MRLQALSVGKWDGVSTRDIQAAATTRFVALLLLGVLTLLLAVFSGMLSFQDKIPDLLFGLTGSGLGGIVGILSGGTGGDDRGDEPAAPAGSTS